MDRYSKRKRQAAAPLRKTAERGKSLDRPGVSVTAAKESSERINPKTVVRRVEAQLLKGHPTAQRQLNPKRVRDMAARLNLDSIGTIHVVDYEIDGVRALWIVDGQHRIAALLECGLGELEVDIMIHRTITTHAGASRKFLELNNMLSIRPFDKYHNAVLAEDPVAAGVDRIAEECGFRVSKQKGPGRLACVAALQRAYRTDSGVSLTQALVILSAAWGTLPSYEGRIIEGLVLMLKVCNAALDRPSLIKKLSHFPGGWEQFVGTAKGGQIGRGVAGKVANQFIATYNLGRSTRRLEFIQ